MIRWLTARLYRKLILSHVGMLVFLFFLLMISASVAYRFHIRDLTQQRFTAQTQIIFNHVQRDLRSLFVSQQQRSVKSPVNAGVSVVKKSSTTMSVTPQYPGVLRPMRRIGQSTGGSGSAYVVPKVKRVGGGQDVLLASLCQRIQESALVLQALVSVQRGDGTCVMEAYPGTFRLYGTQSVESLPEACRKVLSHPSIPTVGAYPTVGGYPVPSSGVRSDSVLSSGGEPPVSSRQWSYRDGRVRFIRSLRPCFYLEHKKKHGWWRDRIFAAYIYQDPGQSLRMTYILHPRFRRVGPLPLIWIAFFLLLVTGIALLTIPIARNITRPMQSLMEGVRKIQGGDWQHPIQAPGHDEVSELSRTVEEMRQSLLHNRQQRRALIADISHEIRTPLSRIRAVSESVADGLMREPDTLTQAMEGICKQVDEIDQLLGDLLDIARLELSDPGQLNCQPIRLTEMLRDMARMFGASARVAQQEIVVAEPSVVVSEVHADARRIRQVLNNLIHNAIRYSPPSGVITLSVQQEGDEVCCRVCDQGPGVPEHEREKIFERLYRIDASRSRLTGGQGLGLAIAKQIIAAHHGKIGVSDASGGGACFWFSLPLGEQEM